MFQLSRNRSRPTVRLRATQLEDRCVPANFAPVITALDAALTTVLARSASGHQRLNYVSVFGSLATVAISSTYRPSAQRSATAVLTRWGGQLLWNAASRELKEFWPDIRRKLTVGWGG